MTPGLLARSLTSISRVRSPNPRRTVIHLSGRVGRVHRRRSILERRPAPTGTVTVWEALCSGATIDQIAAPLPDEFHGWVADVAARLHAEVDALDTRIAGTFAEIMGGLPAGFSRKDFALIAARHELRGYLFARLDGKDYRDALWQRVKPSADETPHGMFGQD